MTGLTEICSCCRTQELLYRDGTAICVVCDFTASDVDTSVFVDPPT